jgi:hypothetical protein
MNRCESTEYLMRVCFIEGNGYNMKIDWLMYSNYQYHHYPLFNDFLNTRYSKIINIFYSVLILKLLYIDKGNCHFKV